MFEEKVLLYIHRFCKDVQPYHICFPSYARFYIPVLLTFVFSTFAPSFVRATFFIPSPYFFPFPLFKIHTQFSVLIFIGFFLFLILTFFIHLFASFPQSLFVFCLFLGVSRITDSIGTQTQTFHPRTFASSSSANLSRSMRTNSIDKSIISKIKKIKTGTKIHMFVLNYIKYIYVSPPC